MPSLRWVWITPRDKVSVYDTRYRHQGGQPVCATHAQPGGTIGKWIGKPSKNRTDLTQPLAAHPRNPLV
jgi:hypothetical protein